MTFGKFILSDHGQANLTSTIPVLPSRDLKRTAELYGKLGFDSVLTDDHEGYLIIRKQWVELHFWPFPQLEPERNTVSAYIRVADVDSATDVFAQVAPSLNGCRFLSPEDKPWGMRQAAFIDHDGNLLQIGTPKDHLNWSNPG